MPMSDVKKLNLFVPNNIDWYMTSEISSTLCILGVCLLWMDGQAYK